MSQIPPHANIVRLWDSFESDHKVYIVMDLCDFGDLSSFVRAYGDRHKRLSERNARHIVRQVLKGLHHMSAHCGVMHRDIKLENILVRKRLVREVSYASEVCAGDFEFKIADLGLAKTHHGEQLLRHTHCGSPLYMAPEILLGKDYNSQADVWSLGVLLFQLLVGAAPFQSKSIPELYKKVHSGVYHLPPTIALSFDCVKFLDQCLQIDVHKRATLSDLTAHSYMESGKQFYYPPQAIRCLNANTTNITLP